MNKIDKQELQRAGWIIPMPQDEIDRLQNNNAGLCDALKTIFTLYGEDKRIATICNDALDKYEE